ncbi:LIP-domain-containing protein [Thozetella sp. PMI_491]|nr:LIP-domain-containing protein [Thozetella sp. PMI_491]
MRYTFGIIFSPLWLGLCRAASNPFVPIPPSQDPFYRPPCGFQNAAPGTVLRSRVATNLTSIIANSSAAYNILYRTTDARGQPSWAVTTLLEPTAISEQSPKKLVSYQIAYDTPSFDWSPSYGLYNIFSEPNSLGLPTDSAFISEMLGRGWHVTVPDYEGPLASFMLGLQSGHAVLDALRASLGAEITGSCEVQTAIWGYSGGGIATAWAAELQPQYAPDLKISGAAVGAPPTNFTFLFDNLNKSLLEFLLPSALIGIVSQFPDAHDAFVAALKKDGPFNETRLYEATTRNQLDNLVAFANQNLYDYLTTEESPLEIPPIQEIVSTQTVLGTYDTPKLPYFVYAAFDDHVVGMAPVEAVVSKYCYSGANILFQQNTVGGHFAEEINGAPRALDFIKEVFGGTFLPATGCKTENVTVAIDTAPDPL